MAPAVASPRLRLAIRYFALAITISIISISRISAAPPFPVPIQTNLGPGAPVGPLFSLDNDTRTFVQYVESCKDPLRPGSQLCDAYTEIQGFYSRIVPEQESLLRDAFSRYLQTNITELCRALVKTAPVLKAISANGGTGAENESKYYKTLTEPYICERRCSDINDEDEKVVVRPICKLLAYELDEISQRNSINDGAAHSSTVISKSTENSPKPSDSTKLDNPAPIVVDPPMIPQQQQPPVAVPQEEKPPQPDPNSIISDKKPVSITPGTNSQLLAEDVQPAVLVSTPGKVPPNAIASGVSSSSSSTVDYSNVIVSSNNEPDDTINKLPALETKQSQQPGGGELDNKQPIGGSLDNEMGGDINGGGVDDPYNGVGAGDEDDDGGDYDQTPDEKLAANMKIKNENLKSKEAESSKTQKAEKDKEKQQQTHNKKPTQVGDSFEDVNRMPVRNNKGSEVIDDPFYEETDSNFFAYFMFFMAICVLGYVAFHNKSKVLALLLEGRRGSASGRGGSSAGSGRRRSGSRKHTANYHKLDSNLEEAITSSGGQRSASSQIIY